MIMATKRKVGPFELQQKLGVGGMGIVYLATYTKTGQKVALKVLSPTLSAEKQLLRRFEREIDILKKLRHPHIVQYYGGGKHGEQRYYAMELMPGGSVEQLIKQRGRLSWEQVIEFGLQICEALEYAHHHAIIHRDLKPANLFLDKSGQLKLGDFGIARDTQATALTSAGKTVGTYAYMAPEQIVGKPPVSPKTDLYALGCVMFEMLTGKPPFLAETHAEMLYQHVENEPPRVTATAIDCPIWLESIVMQLLEKDPEDRYFDALAVHTALVEIGEKVAAQSSVSRQTAVGGPTAIVIDEDRAELKKLLGKKKRKKKKKKTGPFYERAWFLAACLLLLVGALTWALWPLSEEELFARAQPLMETGDVAQWRTAREKYLDPYLKRFPEGKHAAQVEDYVERIEMDKTLRRAEKTASSNREPKSTPERLLVEAIRAENASDRILALVKYRTLISLVGAENSKQDQLYLKIAKRRIVEVQQTGSHNELRFVNDVLRRAEKHIRNGERMKADELWSAVISEYGEKREFERQVDYARKRRNGEDVEPIDFSEPQPAQNANGSDTPDGEKTDTE